jgi:diaminohydroxyphosphoribosylaminopyrimidine deaminase/5-amino-6-(5-phosphoribosylamino)uracil reductase
MKNQNTLWMRRCLELAENGKGKVAPNPMVGCVIVHDNIIIGEGFHQKFGDAHAEVNAINSVKNQDLLSESTLYVNLEPCSHFGKTPPCSHLIVDKKIKKVIVGAIDFHELVAGKGIDYLQNKGVEVVVNVLEKECHELNKRFYTFYEKKRPFYILKWAQSMDGFIYSKKADAKISNHLSQQKVHQIRSEEMAILIGKNTLINDNPSLTNRLVAGKSPLRIVVVNRLEKAMWNTQIFKDGLPTLIFNTEKSVQENHLEFIQYESEKLIQTLNLVLFEKGIQSVLVEGGTNIFNQFLSENNWDEMIQIKSNKTLENGLKAPNVSSLSLNKTLVVGNDSWNYYVNC